MKTTLTLPHVTASRERIRQNRDARIAAEFMQAALSGLLAGNAFYDPDSLSVREKYTPEEINSLAEAHALDLFDRWRAWRKEEEHNRALRANRKVINQ